MVGAGASGAEIASAYARFGTDVVLFDIADAVLPTEDVDISKVVQRCFTQQGIKLSLGIGLNSAESGESEVRYSHSEGEGSAEWLVLAAGRRPDIEALGLGALGIQLSTNGLIEVDERGETSIAGIYAIGDLVNGPALAHKASEEGIIAVEAAFGLRVEPLEHAFIPRATFCSPNVASFGLTESQAREAGFDVVIARVPFSSVGAAQAYGETSGLVKLVGDRSLGEILGGHVVGQRAMELMQQVLNVRSLEGGFPELARIVHSHPTFSELISEAGRGADGWQIHG